MKIGDRARVINAARGTFGEEGEIVYISPEGDSDNLPVVDLKFQKDGGSCRWSYVADEIETV